MIRRIDAHCFVHKTLFIHSFENHHTVCNDIFSNWIGNLNLKRGFWTKRLYFELKTWSCMFLLLLWLVDFLFFGEIDTLFLYSYYSCASFNIYHIRAFKTYSTMHVHHSRLYDTLKRITSHWNRWKEKLLKF